MSDLDPITEHALALVELGMHVFPLKPRSKQPGTVNGLKDASSDPLLVRAMFRPGYLPGEKGIGVSCGPSNLLVIDLDGPEGVARRELFPPTLTVVTGKGLHLYYSGRGRSTVKWLGAGIDTRGEGGYVVAPPSVHPDGHRYRWEDASVPLADLPAGLAQRLRKRSAPTRRRRKPDVGTATMLLRCAVERFRAEAVEGARNDSLNRNCWATRDLERHEVLARLWVAEAEAVGLPIEEATRTVASALGTTNEEVVSWL